ncbi:MAG: DUF2911 domain-containing protein [Pseudarcicella sp.]|nr:DUF2911 domain-containing protein [Pseudarcicella sp.]MBP6409542.1 DUF2911 domain-containing protein [Pseudarcicella sp.]
MTKLLRLMLILLAILASSFVFFRFYYTKTFSPHAKVTSEKMGVSIEYCRPSKKNRLIFGKESEKALVPFDKWWRTGANEATLINFDSDVIFGDKIIKAGNYSLFTIPSKDEWTFIINNEIGQWGLSYDPKKDIIKTKVKSLRKTDTTEMFTISLNDNETNTELLLEWDNTYVVLPIKK